VSEAAAELQVAGLIHYSRGVITIVDRAGLERRACECYWVVTREWDRLLGTDFLADPKRTGRAAPTLPAS
jgi:hypothetical protein